MAEILTESFCERCGTRYTFQAAAPRRQRLGKFKVLSKGLRKYVLDDSTTLDEAFAEARSDEEREISSHQVEAFHQTFNFCLTCRQYTCGNCWNEAEGRCLTCAPNLSQEILPTAFPTLGTTIAPAPETNGHEPAPAGDLVWPTIDLRRLEEEAAASEAVLPVEAEPGVAEAEPIPTEAVEASADALAAPDEALAAPDEALAAAADDEIVDEPWPAVGDEDFDADIAARLDALAGPPEVASPEPEAAEPEALEPEALEPEALEPQPAEAIDAGSRIEPIAAQPTAIADDEADVPLDVLEAVRAKAAAEQAVAPVAEEAAISTEDRDSTGIVDAPAEAAISPEPTSEPAATIEPEVVVLPGPEESAAEPASPEQPPLRTESDAADRAAAAAARTAWLLSQFRPEAGAEEAMAAAETAEPEDVEDVDDLEPAAATDGQTAATPDTDEALPRRDDRVEVPTWSIVAPVETTPPVEPAAPEPTAPPDTRWPTPAWPSTPETPPVWARPAAERPSWPQPDPVNLAPRPNGGATGLWAESSREVLARNGTAAATGVQACVHCGLPLSATARFCRRCGSSQTNA